MSNLGVRYQANAQKLRRDVPKARTCAISADKAVDFMSSGRDDDPSVATPRAPSPQTLRAPFGTVGSFSDPALMDPFVQQLATLCRAEVTRAKWVFVPSHALGRTLGEQIALGGTNWLNLRFVTPLDIALRMGAPFLVERGIEPSEEGLGPALIMRLLLELPRGGGVRGHPRLALALGRRVATSGRWRTSRRWRRRCRRRFASCEWQA